MSIGTTVKLGCEMFLNSSLEKTRVVDLIIVEESFHDSKPFLVSSTVDRYDLGGHGRRGTASAPR